MRRTEGESIQNLLPYTPGGVCECCINEKQKMDKRLCQLTNCFSFSSFSSLARHLNPIKLPLVRKLTDVCTTNEHRMTKRLRRWGRVTVHGIRHTPLVNGVVAISTPQAISNALNKLDRQCVVVVFHSSIIRTDRWLLGS